MTPLTYLEFQPLIQKTLFLNNYYISSTALAIPIKVERTQPLPSISSQWTRENKRIYSSCNIIAMLAVSCGNIGGYEFKSFKGTREAFMEEIAFEI